MAVEDDDDIATFFDEDAPGYAQAAQVASGVASTVAVLFDTPRTIGGLGTSGMPQENPSIRVRKSECADPKKLDTWTIDTTTYKFGHRELDPSGKIWTISLNPQ